MRRLNLLAVPGVLFCLCLNLPAYAQAAGESDDEIAGEVIETIVVTGRNRAESLQEVPVATSVLTETFIKDAGVQDLYDLFELVPGLNYDQQIDRLGAQPSVRGVTSNDISSNRVKVTAFIDGMPVLGSIGSIGFNSFEQVEIYRGPQSAAFGRSTFAGAINYITKDPGDDFSAEIAIDGNDYGTQIVRGSIGTPITENLGVLVQFQHEDSGAPSEYRATGNGAYNETLGTNVRMSDGTEFGALSGENVSAKLVFEPTDSVKTSLTFGHVETHDGQVPELWLTEAERNACFEGKGFKPVTTQMGGINVKGDWDCDWGNVDQPYANHDDVAYLKNNPLLLNYLVDLAINPAPVDLGMMMFGPPGPAATDRVINGQLMTVEEQILMVAQAYSIPKDERGTKSERDRITFQAEKLFDNGSALNFSVMHNEETQNRLQDVNIYYYDPDNLVTATVNQGLFQDGVVDGMGGGLSIRFNGDPDGDPLTADGIWERLNGMGAPRYIQASPTDIEENYAEARWVSPGSDHLRFVIGASYYDYEYLEENYGNTEMGFFGVAYGAKLYGIVPEFEELTGLNFAPDNGILSENATNTAVFFNVGYDLNDKITLSAEGRYQSDKVGGVNTETGLTAEVTTESFLPRLAATYTHNDNTTFYLQWSKGVNPAGINVDMLNQRYIDSINAGVANALIPYDPAFDVDDIINATGAPGQDGFIDDYNTVTETFDTLTGATYKVDFTAETFQSYGEEELTNFEFGFKGAALDGRFNYAGAIYMIKWKDQLQNGAIEWDGPCSNNQNGAAPLAINGIAPCMIDGQQYFYVPNANNTNVGGVGLNYGDVDIKGIEFEGTYRISDNWQIRGTASLLDATYDSFCDISLFFEGIADEPRYIEPLDIELLTPGPGSTISSPCYIVDGKEVAGQPKFSGSISPSFNADLGSGMRFGARLDIRHEGAQWLESNNWSKLPSVTSTNVSFSLSGEAWGATLYINNLTDEDTPRRINDGGYLDAFFTNSTTSTDFTGTQVDLINDNVRIAPRIPRTIGLRASYRF